MSRTIKSFEDAVFWPIAEAGLKRAIYLIEHHRMSQIPLAYRKQIGIFISRKWIKGLDVKETKQQ